MNQLKAIIIITLLMLPMGFFNRPITNKLEVKENINLHNNSDSKNVKIIKPPLEVETLEYKIFSLRIPVDLRGYKLLGDSNGIVPFYEGADLEVIPGRPVVPVFTYVEKLPIDAKIINVRLENFSYSRETINARFLISPTPLAIGYNISFTASSISYKYPSKWIEYEVKYGMDPENLERVKFLIIRFYPIRIIDENTFLRATSAIISVSFIRNERDFSVAQVSSIELLIITNKTLYPYALELAKMKNESGIPTIVKLVEDIYSTYPGRDKAEKIRNAINDTVNSLGIKYLLILGDSDVVPVRYVYVPDGAFDDEPEIDGKFVETDLYYADLQYSWDDNNDGLWGDLKHDKVDGIPDIFVGRIPASTPEEAEAYIKKLGEYKPVEGWWNRALLIGTDTFMRFTPEGEFLSENISKIIFSNFTITRLYETGGNITLMSLLHYFSLGYGFINYAGHGDNHLLYVTLGQSFTSVHAESLRNAPRYPIIFTMACSSGRFGDIDGFGERLVLNPQGGVIAYIGSSRIAWGYISRYVTEGLAGGMNVLFVKSLFSPLRDRLGRVWGNMITQYVLKHDFKQEEPGYGYIEWKTITEYNLLGDPTLSFKAKVYENSTTVSGSFDNLIIKNSYSKLSGNVVSSNLTIINATIDLNGFNITVLSNISIINSNIIGEGYIILSNNVNASFSLSDIAAPVVMLDQSNVTAVNSAISIISSSSNVHLKATNSSVEFIYEISSGSYTLDLEDGFFESKTFTSIDIKLSDSFISWKLKATDSKITLSKSVTELNLVNSTAEFESITIPIVKVLKGSKVTATNSEIGALFIELQDYEEVSLSPGNLTGLFFGVNLTNVTVRFISIEATKGAKISSSKLLKLIADDKTTVNNSNIARIIANADLNLLSSEAFYLAAYNGKINISSANITHTVVEGAEVLINHSHLYTFYLLSGAKVDLYNSTIFHADFRLDSYAKLTFTDVYEIVLFENSKVVLENSTVLMLTMYNSSKAELRMSAISYLLRQYDETLVILKENSTATPQLTFRNVNVTIRDLPFGYITNYTLDKYGWSIRVENSSIEFWDINAYNAYLSIENAYIYWIMAYFNSQIYISNSIVYVIRATHNSTVYANEIINLITFASSYAHVEIRNSQVVLQAAFLDSSEGQLTNVVFGEIIALGNAKVDVYKSVGTDIAVLGKSQMTITDTKSQLWIYVEDTDLSDTTISLKNGFISSWSSDSISKKLPMKIIIKNSLVSWLLLFWNSSTKITNSEVDILAFLECDKQIVVTDTIVNSFAYFYRANTTVEGVTFANITVVITSEFIGKSSEFFVFFMWNSSIYIEDSYLVPGIVLEDSNGIIRNFRPYRGDFKVGDYFNIDTTELSFKIINSSILGLVFDLFGRANLTVENSAFDGIVLLDNSSVSVENSVLGSIYAMDYSKASITSSSVGEIWFYIKKYSGELPELKKHVQSLHIYPGASEISVSNSNISKWSITIISSTVKVSEKLEKLEATNSKIEIENSSISELIASESEIKVFSSKISKFTLTYYSNTHIVDSSIAYFTYDSSIKAEIENSAVGLYIRLLSAHGELTIVPINNFSGSIRIVPADITFKNVNITNFFVYIGGFSELSIINSKIHKVSISGKSEVSIFSSDIDSLSVYDQSSVSVIDSEVGLELLFKDVYSSDEVKVPSGSVLSDSILVPNQWKIDFSSSTVDWINVTVLGSNSFTLTTKALYLIIFGGDIKLKNARAGLASIYFSNLIMEDSKIGYALLYEGVKASISSTDIGLVKIIAGSYTYSEEHAMEFSYATIVDDISGSEIGLSNSKITDYSYVLLLNSTLIANNSQLGLLELIDTSNALLINSTVEMIPYVDDFALLEVYWYLTIRVSKDFSPAQSANVTIYRGEKLVAQGLTNENGKITFLLPQARITADERVDLGNYKVVARADGLEGSRDVYLYTTMVIEISLISPLLMGVIILTLITAAIVIAQKIYEKKKVKKKESLETLQ